MHTLLPRVELPVEFGEPPASTRVAVWRRVWRMPLLAHAAVALALLCGMAAWIGTSSSFTSDEGEDILQAQAIQHGGWTVPNPVLQPVQGTGHPLQLTSGTATGVAPLGKHLFYGDLLALVGRRLGVPGMVGLSLLGTVLAALLAAALSREIRPGLERVTFWFTAMGTPLFFDGFTVVGHTVAAALVAASALLLLRYLRCGALYLLAGAMACCAVACLLRTETILWCVGLAVAALVTVEAAGSRRWARAVPAAATVLGSCLVAREADTRLSHHAVGAATTLVPGDSGGQGFIGQVDGFFVSWLQSGTGRMGVVSVLLVAVLVVVAYVARHVRLGRAAPGAVLLTVGGLAALWVLQLAQPSHLVFGLAVACPVVWTGIWLVGRSLLRIPAARLCVVASAVFTVLVIGAQNSLGGGAQWGGRYFADALPVFAPAALEAFRMAGARLVPRAAKGVVVLAAVVTGLTGVGAVQSLRTYHQVHAALAGAITTAAEQSPAGDGGLPVVVTSQSEERWGAWPIYDQVRWQVAKDSSMPALGAELRAAGVSHIVLVTTDPGPEIRALSESFRRISAEPVPRAPGWSVLSLGPA